MATAESVHRSRTNNREESPFPIHLKLGDSREEMLARFDAFARNNPSLQLEQTADGEIVMMLPTGGKSGLRSTEVLFQVRAWAGVSGGYVFDSSTLFRLPDGAKRGPDCAWVVKERWDALNEDEQESYPPLAPDLVIEVRSKTVRLSPLQLKMDEYLSCGVRLGWLIDPYERKVYAFRPDHEMLEMVDPASLDGEEVARGLTLKLAPIFDLA